MSSLHPSNTPRVTIPRRKPVPKRNYTYETEDKSTGKASGVETEATRERTYAFESQSAHDHPFSSGTNAAGFKNRNEVTQEAAGVRGARGYYETAVLEAPPALLHEVQVHQNSGTRNEATGDVRAIAAGRELASVNSKPTTAAENQALNLGSSVSGITTSSVENHTQDPPSTALENTALVDTQLEEDDDDASAASSNDSEIEAEMDNFHLQQFSQSCDAGDFDKAATFLQSVVARGRTPSTKLLDPRLRLFGGFKKKQCWKECIALADSIFWTEGAVDDTRAFVAGTTTMICYKELNDVNAADRWRSRARPFMAGLSTKRGRNKWKAEYEITSAKILFMKRRNDEGFRECSLFKLPLEDAELQGLLDRAVESKYKIPTQTTYKASTTSYIHLKSILFAAFEGNTILRMYFFKQERRLSPTDILSLYCLYRRGGDTKMIGMLVGLGADVNHRVNSTVSSSKQNSYHDDERFYAAGDTPLISYVVRQGDARVAEHLLQHKPNLQIIDNASLIAPLEEAIGQNRPDLIELLLAHGADYNYGRIPPFEHARFREDIPAVAVFMARGANYRWQDFADALFVKTMTYPEFSKHSKAILDQSPRTWASLATSTPLHCIARYYKGYLDDDFVKMIASSSSLNRKDPIYGMTPLHYATENSVGMCKAFLQGGADRTVRNKHGETAAQYARDPRVKWACRLAA